MIAKEKVVQRIQAQIELCKEIDSDWMSLTVETGKSILALLEGQQKDIDELTKSIKGMIEGQKVFYRCDPEKNTECKKRLCSLTEHRAFGCRCTSNPDYAVRDSKGEPITAYIHFDYRGPIGIDGGAEW